MKAVLFLAFNLACVLAGPSPYGSSVNTVVQRSPQAVQYSSSNVGILNQFNRHNDDGSYTFGYESGDGSFRIENRDVDGFVTGKYGYIDANGQPQEFEYVAGSINGRTLGYQARGTAIPVTDRAKAFPVVASNSLAQKGLDYQYSSVDEDGDGFPDRLNPVRGNRNKGQSIVRLTSQAATAFDTPSQVVRVVNPTPAVNIEPTVVRVATPVQTEAPQQSVRVVDPTPVVSQQPATVVRVTSQKAKSVIQPVRATGFQVIKQSRQRQPQLVQSVVRSPFFGRFGGQQFVTRTPVVSTSRLNPFIGTGVRDSFGRLIVRSNQQSSFNPSIQTIIVDDDDFDDLDDVNDFDDDDDDTFIVDSASFGR